MAEIVNNLSEGSISLPEVSEPANTAGKLYNDGGALKFGDTVLGGAGSPAGGSGDVSKVGTPVNDQVAVWTGEDTIEGHTGFRYISSSQRILFGSQPIQLIGNVSTGLQIQSNSADTNTLVLLNSAGAQEGAVHANSDDIYLLLGNNETAFKGIQNAQSEMYYNNAIHLATAFSGIVVTGKILASASTSSNSSISIPEGSAPSAPADGDVWVTAAGGFFVRLNGVSVDLASGGGLSNIIEDTSPQLGGTLDTNDFGIVGKAGVTDSVGSDLELAGGDAASIAGLISAQQQDDYTGAGDQGTYVGGDGVGGTAYVALDTITLSDGSLITVGTVDGNGDVTAFTVTTPGGTTVTLGVALTQTGTSGTGAGFTLTPETGNVTGKAGGNINLTPGAGAGGSQAGIPGEVILGGTLNINDFSITSPKKVGGTNHHVNILPGIATNDTTTSNDVNITGGTMDYLAGSGNVTAGDINISGGGLVNRNNTAHGGSVNIVGASLPLQTATEYAGYGGQVNITSGSVPNGDYAYGGNINVKAGDAYATGNLSIGGHIEIISGSGYDISGDIILQAGGNDSGGNAGIDSQGAVIIQASAPAYGGVSGEATTLLRFQGLRSNTTFAASGRATDNFIALKAPDNIGTGEFTLTLPATDSTGTQALVSDGSGTLSWADIGDVIKVTTPANNQIAVWTGDGTIEGTTGLTFISGILEVSAGFTFGSSNIDITQSASSTTRLKSGNSAGSALELVTSSNEICGFVWGDDARSIGFKDAGGDWSYQAFNDGNHEWYSNGATERMVLDNTGLLSITGGVTAPTLFNAQSGTAYTAVLTDVDKMITMDNVAANIVTIPTNVSVAYPIGTKLNFMQLGAGQTTIAIDSGGSPATDTLNVEAASSLKATGQYAIITALKITSTSWVLSGNLEAA